MGDNAMEPTTQIDEAAVGAAVAAMRTRQPLVQCLTNTVVANFSANLLLAAGAAPAMIDNPQEAGGFAAVAGAVLVNTGTPQDDTVAGMHEAVRGCSTTGTPWVLDPVGAGGLPWRTRVAADLMRFHPPHIVRGNASEILGLVGGAGGRGVDSADLPEDALSTGLTLASRVGTVVAISGPVDQITDGTRTVSVANGDPLLTRVTGVGCGLGALMAAFAATVEDPLLAAVGATALLTVAAEQALPRCSGPGSFAVALLDALDSLSPEQIEDSVRLGRP